MVAAICRQSIAHRSSNPSLRQIRNRNGMGLTVNHTVIAGHYHLGCYIIVFQIVAIPAMLHNGKALVRKLRQHLLLQIMPLQPAVNGMVSAITECTILAALNRNLVVLLICLFIGYFFI